MADVIVHGGCILRFIGCKYKNITKLLQSIEKISFLEYNTKYFIIYEKKMKYILSLWLGKIRKEENTQNENADDC